MTTAQKFSDAFNGLRVLKSDFGIEPLGFDSLRSRYCVGSSTSGEGRTITFVDGSSATLAGGRLVADNPETQGE